MPTVSPGPCMPGSSRRRALCLAFAVVGPLTLSNMLNRMPKRAKCESKRGEEGDDASKEEPKDPPQLKKAVSYSLHAIGDRAQALFSAVEWGTIKGLLSFLGGVDQCLEWLGASGEIPQADVPYIRAGMEMLQRLDAEHTVLTEDVAKLREELNAARKRYVALSRENEGLKRRLASAMDHERIIEQDRVQINALLDDKTRLQEDNAALQREIGSLQELLEYAEDRNRMEETTGAEEGDEDDDEDEDGAQENDDDQLSDDSRVEKPERDDVCERFRQN